VALFEERPLPDVSRYADEPDGSVRLRHVLEDLFGYYATTERLLEFALQNMEATPILRAASVPFVEALERAYQVVAAGWDASAPTGSLLAGAIRHAIAFATWQSLRNEQRLADGDAVDLMVGLVASVAAAATQIETSAGVRSSREATT